MSIDALEEIFHPQAIAVVGASENPTTRGHDFIRHLLDYNYRGRIYPVNPNQSEVLGIKAYPSLRDIPGSVCYVICCIPAPEVLGLLEDCTQKRVKAVHLFTARFSETGRSDAAELENEILKRARKEGIRLIGPNCLGIYYPREGLSFGYDFPREPGSAGALFQSGGASNDLIRLASLRGIRFSKVVSYGNALDYDESDFLDYFAQDPETEIILGYVEGVKNGKRFFNALRSAASVKPVIIIKGGRGKSGTRAVASHTAALAGSMPIWEAVIAQAGAIPARNLDEMTDIAVSFYFLPPITGLRVGIAGGGGGKSVLSADECEEAGLDVIPLPPEIREKVRSKAPPIGDWIGNPTDASIMQGVTFSVSDMLQMMARNQNFDFLIANIGEDRPVRKQGLIRALRGEVEGYIKVERGKLKPLLVVVGEKSLGIENYSNWRWKLVCELRTQLIAAGIPIYPTVGRAARAIRKLIDYYVRRK